MRALRAVPVPLILVALIAVAGWTLGRIFTGPLVVQLVLGAAVGSVVVGVACRRLPSWLVAPVSAVGLAGYTLLALRLAADRAALPGGLSEVAADALRNGIPRLLTAMIPVEPTPDTVVVPVVAAWLAGLAGTELAVRAGRVLLGFAPAAALYAAVGYVVGPNAPGSVWPAVAFAALVAVGLAVTGRPAGQALDTPGTDLAPDTPGADLAPAGSPADLPGGVRAAVRARTAAGLALGLVGVLAVTALAGPWVAGQVDTAPVDPRRYVQPPQVDSLDESPLIRISGWALNPDQHLFDMTSRLGAAPPNGAAAGAPDTAPAAGRDAAGAGQRVRLAVLPDYDGASWRVGATYRGAGRVLPVVPTAAGARVETVEHSIVVADLTGRLLPAIPTPRAVQGARVAFDPATGTLIRPEGLTAGLRYDVTSARERPDLNLLPSADVPAGEQVARFLRLGEGVPPQLQKLADQLARDNGAPYERAVAIEQFLGEHYRVVADAPSGHGYQNLAFFLFGPRHGGGQRGTSEQFAASFAVLGRLMGLPTRVVVGFRAPAADGPVRGADAYAWPEVLFNSLGWVPFDPLPRRDAAPRPVEEDFNPRPERTPPPSDAPTPTVAPSAAPDAPAPAAPPSAGASPAVLVGAGASGLAVLLTATGALVLLLRRGQRRRRLADGDPAQRITGAWLEVTDALRLAGRSVPGHLAASDVAAHAAAAADGGRPGSSDRPALPPVDDLAALLNTAAFGPAAAGAEQAQRAGAHAVAYADGLRARQPWWRRVWWSVHPGPLRWHRRR